MESKAPHSIESEAPQGLPAFEKLSCKSNFMVYDKLG